MVRFLRAKPCIIFKLHVDVSQTAEAFAPQLSGFQLRSISGPWLNCQHAVALCNPTMFRVTSGSLCVNIDIAFRCHTLVQPVVGYRPPLPALLT